MKSAAPEGLRDARTRASRQMRRWRPVMARGVRAGPDQANALRQASRERERERDKQPAGWGKAYMGRLSVRWGALRLGGRCVFVARGQGRDTALEEAED